MKLYDIKINCNTKRQALKCFGVLFLNHSFLGKLEISGYERSVSLVGLPFQHQANSLIRIIESKKLRFRELRLTERTKEKEIIKELKGGINKNE